MVQWFFRFSEFAKCSEFLFHLGKAPLWSQSSELIIRISLTLISWPGKTERWPQKFRAAWKVLFVKKNRSLNFAWPNSFKMKAVFFSPWGMCNSRLCRSVKTKSRAVSRRENTRAGRAGRAGGTPTTTGKGAQPQPVGEGHPRGRSFWGSRRVRLIAYHPYWRGLPHFSQSIPGLAVPGSPHTRGIQESTFT